MCTTVDITFFEVNAIRSGNITFAGTNSCQEIENNLKATETDSNAIRVDIEI